MGNDLIPLEPGRFYHIYNRGIDKTKIFREPANYGFFLTLYDKYISGIADTYAYALMGNHFHLLIRTFDSGVFADLDVDPQIYIRQQFSNFLNSYAQAYNKRYNRKGSLFQHNFKRKLIENHDYLKQTLIYIHNNPVHHHICNDPLDYKWTSYKTCISVHPTKLNRNEVLGWFDNEANFHQAHKDSMSITSLENFLEI